MDLNTFALRIDAQFCRLIFGLNLCLEAKFIEYVLCTDAQSHPLHDSLPVSSPQLSEGDPDAPIAVGSPDALIRIYTYVIVGILLPLMVLVIGGICCNTDGVHCLCHRWLSRTIDGSCH